ncbi:MAG: hypothetical protein WAU81_03555, partial [Candidatus Aminicenantales bacterium]
VSGRREASKAPWRSHGDCFVTLFLAMTISALGENGRGFDATAPSLNGVKNPNRSKADGG